MGSSRFDMSIHIPKLDLYLLKWGFFSVLLSSLVIYYLLPSIPVSHISFHLHLINVICTLLDASPNSRPVSVLCIRSGKRKMYLAS
jgi:hypothetical protein